jgi:amino acid adenylation domain-containing protein
LRRVRSDLMDALDHPLMTQGTVARALGLRSNGDRPPLTGVYFNLNPLVDLSAFEPLSATLHEGRKAGLLGEVFFNFYEKPDALSLDLHYSTEFFSAGRARELVSALVAQCEALADSLSDGLASTSPTADPRLVTWNQATATPMEPHARLEQWVSRQAAATPDSVALVTQGTSLTYAALESRANRFAHTLLARGVGAGALVGVCLSRVPDLIPALLGILKTGAAYVPLDPGFPKDRLHYMAEDAGVRLVITDAVNADRSGVERERQLRIDDDADTLSAAPDRAVPAHAGWPEDAPAYVIYTSGSTGKPKGVVLPQKAVCNFLASMRQEPGLKVADRLLAVTTLSFDIAVLELFLPLVTGACVVLAEREDAMDGEALIRLLAAQRINVMQATPTTWHLLLDAGWQASAGFRALCGGEPLPPSLAERLLDAGVELWNLYGPTETTVWSTLCRITDPKQRITIGRPIANTQVWVVDEHLRPCAIGQEGELCIGGAGVASGYFNRPELTAEKFVPNPFDTAPGSRLYRTGDLARWREDGALEHLGRLDFQVKIRGYRIELGEIEARLANLPGIARTVVVAREDSPGDVRLVGYAVPHAGNTPDPTHLREALRSGLPDYMLPQQIVLLDALPLLPNGKVDRKSLPIPVEAAGVPPQDFLPPTNELESQLAAAMASVLKLPAVGIDDDFFSLGGHSLLAARLVGQINRELGLQLALRTLFESPTVEKLAAAVCKARGVDAVPPRAPLLRRPQQDTAPLTLMQERIHFVERMQPGRLGYHAPSGHRLRGPMNVAAFDQAFQAVVQRQDAFRTAIVAAGDGFVQRTDQALSLSLLPLTDLSTLAPPQQEQALLEDMNRQTAQLFTLDRGPLIRARLYKLADDHHALFLMAHHIVWDGWSFDIFYAEMAALYDAFLQGKPSPLPPLQVSYGDFATWHNTWMQSDEIREQCAYWKQQLGAPRMRPEAHVDKPRPKVGSGNAATEHIVMDAALVARVQAFARRTGSTTSIVLLAAYAALMAQWMDEPMPTIGLPVRGRPSAELEGVMGFFNNMLPLRLHVDMSLSMTEWVRRVRQLVTEAIANQDVPFERISQELNLPAGAIYQALFNFQDVRARQTRWGNLQHERIHVTLDGASEDMSLWLVEAESGVSGGFKYDPDVFLASSVAALRDRFARLVAAGMQNPEQPLNALLAPAPQELAALDAWEAPQPPFNTRSIARLVEQHWGARSQDVALRAGARSWTGLELIQELTRLQAAIEGKIKNERRLVVMVTNDPFYQVLGLLAAVQTGVPWSSLSRDDPRLPAALSRQDLALAIGESDLVSGSPTHIPWLSLDNPPSAKATFSTAASIPLQLLAADGLAALLGSLGATVKAGRHDIWLACLDAERPLFAFLQAAAALAAGSCAVLDTPAAPNQTTDLGLLLQETKATIVRMPAATWDRWLASPGQAQRPGMTALVDAGMASPVRVAALLAAKLSVVSVYREAELGLPLAAGALTHSSEAHLLGRPLNAGHLKLTDARGQRTAPGIAGELQALAPEGDRRWQSTGTRARWRSDGQLQHLGGSRGASFAEQPVGGVQSGVSSVPALAMTAAEREMHGLWCELLGRSDMGLDDNFFDLGGYSLLAMSLVAAIEIRMGKKIQPASLLEAPTIRRLSALVERSKGQSSLLKLRPGTGGPGVFFIHDIDGEVLLYRNLAMRLNPRHPVYALRPHGDEEFAILHTRISEMADHYVEQIISVQPEGPYILAGLCAGGEIALEVACRLQAQGERIAALALLESAHANATVRPGLMLGIRVARLKQALNANKESNAMTRVVNATITATRKTLSALRYQLASRIAQAKLGAELRDLQMALDKGERPKPGSRKLTVRQIVSHAQRSKRVHGRLAGDALLLRARHGDGTQADQPFIEIFEDPLFGWSSVVDGKVVVADVDGGHSSMLQEPFVASTQAVFQAYIEEALTAPQTPQPQAPPNLSAHPGALARGLHQPRDLAQT